MSSFYGTSMRSNPGSIVGELSGNCRGIVGELSRNCRGIVGELSETRACSRLAALEGSFSAVSTTSLQPALQTFNS